MFRRPVVLFVSLCLFAVLVPAVASAHPPEAKTVCPDGYTLSTDETECSKPVVKDHGEAQCDPGYSLVARLAARRFARKRWASRRASRERATIT